MRFSWPGVLLAPLAVPVLFSVAMAGLFGSDSPAPLVLIMLVTSSVVSYGATLVLFLPCLFVLSALRPMTWITVCLLGLVLGAAAYVPMTWMDWQSSGTDSGPPDEPFFAFLLRWMADPFALIFPVAGMVTAGLYWGIGTRWQWRAGVAGR